MNYEMPFRLLLVAVTLTGITARIVVQRRAARLGGPMRPGRDPPMIPFASALLIPLMLVPLIAYILNPAWLPWTSLPVPVALRCLGAGLLCLGAAILLAVFRSLGSNTSRHARVRRNATLVTSGPYRWVQHPLYSTAFLMWVAVFLMTARWPIALGLVLLAPMLRWRIRAEESNLLDRFGAQYREYVRRTPRFIPRLTAAPPPDRAP